MSALTQDYLTGASIGILAGMVATRLNAPKNGRKPDLKKLKADAKIVADAFFGEDIPDPDESIGLYLDAIQDGIYSDQTTFADVISSVDANTKAINTKIEEEVEAAKVCVSPDITSLNQIHVDTDKLVRTISKWEEMSYENERKKSKIRRLKYSTALSKARESAVAVGLLDEDGQLSDAFTDKYRTNIKTRTAQAKSTVLDIMEEVAKEQEAVIVDITNPPYAIEEIDIMAEGDPFDTGDIFEEIALIDDAADTVDVDVQEVSEDEIVDIVKDIVSDPDDEADDEKILDVPEAIVADVIAEAEDTPEEIVDAEEVIEIVEDMNAVAEMTTNEIESFTDQFMAVGVGAEVELVDEGEIGSEELHKADMSAAISSLYGDDAALPVVEVDGIAGMETVVMPIIEVEDDNGADASKSKAKAKGAKAEDSGKDDKTETEAEMMEDEEDDFDDEERTIEQLRRNARVRRSKVSRKGQGRS